MFLISCQAPGAPVKPLVPPAALLGWWQKADTSLSHCCPHPQKSHYLCVYSRVLGTLSSTRSSSSVEGFLDFCSSLPSRFQPQCSECLTLLSRVAAGPFPACPQSSSWEHISCPQSHRSYTYLLCRFKEQDAEAGSCGGWKNQQSHRV